MPFSKLGLSAPLTQALAELKYTQPTPIQAKAIPVALKGQDILAAAQTGTGKTASFVLPILEKLSAGETQRKKRCRALILAPTRELVLQVNNSIKRYSAHLPLRSMVVYGGVELAPQKQALIEGTDIIVATPGRLLDLHSQRAVHFDELETLVLDEADKMLDMGFIAYINKIIERLPKTRQNLLFSATLSPAVRKLAKTAIDKPVEITITPNKATTATITQWLVTTDKDKKSALLSHLIKENQWQQALIFIQTKHGAAKLVSQLEKRGITAQAIHSGRSQPIREKILAEFKSGTLGFLVATGVAARGIDINELERVVNYDLPFEPDDYIHRIGRTGRAGAQGEAITLLSKDDFKNLCAIESRLGHLIERKEIEGFKPKKEVPISILNYQPKNKRPQPADDKKAAKPKAAKPKKFKPQATKPAKTKPSKKASPENSDSPWAKWKSK